MNKHKLALGLVVFAACGNDPQTFDDPAQGPDYKEAYPTGTDITWPHLGMPETRADTLVPAGPQRERIVLSRFEPQRGSTWPMLENGILRRLAGPEEPSAAEKYGRLYLDPAQRTQMTTWIQLYHGKEQMLTEPFAGICQGFAHAAVSEPPPQRAILVRRAGKGARSYLLRCRESDANRPGSGCVRFSPSDLNALLSESYSTSEGRVVAARCTNAQIQFTDGGRALLSGCQSDRDPTDAGLFFVALTNYIGRHRRPLVAIFDTPPLWVRPIYGYRVVHFDKVDAQSAANLAEVKKSTPKTPYGDNPDAADFRVVEFSLLTSPHDEQAPGTPGRDYLTVKLLLELSESGRVIGGRWLGESKETHPSGTYLPVGPATPVPHLSYRNVRMLLDLAK